MRFFVIIGQVMLAALFLSACQSYKQNIMFKIPEGTQLDQHVAEAQKNYIIQKNDILKIRVYTKNGEIIIDPDYTLMKDLPSQNMQRRPDPVYLVDVNGVAKFPMIGELKVEGLTIRQGEAILQKEYASFYSDAFVVLEYTNKRVVVLGAPGGMVIPLVNENVTLVEILALATGIANDAMAHNLRILRGDQVFLADLSTIDGYRKGNMIIQHGDIIYVEPIRRPVSEAVRDYGPIISIITSLTTLLVVLVSL
jgi:polysaccharide biosynthesis/export protein